MIVVSSREFRDNQKKFFDLAEKERVVIKRKNQFMELVPRGEIIPESVSPSNDPYFDDPRNIAAILEGVQQVKEGRVTRINSKVGLQEFLDNL